MAGRDRGDQYNSREEGERNQTAAENSLAELALTHEPLHSPLKHGRLNGFGPDRANVRGQCVTHIVDLTGADPPREQLEDCHNGHGQLRRWIPTKAFIYAPNEILF